VPRFKDDAVSGRDHFAEIYRDNLEAEARWQQYGAIGKVDSIEALLRIVDLRPRTLVELGAGAGAVILECQRRGLGTELSAIDFSEEAIGYLQNRANGITCTIADITDEAFPRQQADVVVLSHVLEHLERPIPFLKSIIEKIDFEYLVAEVPLEDLWGSRLKNLFRDRTKNAAGHVQFFTPSTFTQMLEAAGLEIVHARRYVPILTTESISFVAKKDRMTRSRALMKAATGRYLPLLLRPIWARLYYAHYTVLCRPSTKARAHSSKLINIQS
jgi:trans-aconitate methyltransferase